MLVLGKLENWNTPRTNAASNTIPCVLVMHACRPNPPALTVRPLLPVAATQR